MDPKQFKDLVIRPVLVQLGLHSAAAENLLLGTATQESRLTYLQQLGSGPALGVFQMEPATHDDIWENFLKYKPELARKVRQLASVKSIRGDGSVNPFEMVGNHFYAAAMARIHYYRKPESLPLHDDVQGMGEYWKRHYNTYLGKGSADEFVSHYPVGLDS